MQSQYYDCENIKESKLSFRIAVAEPRYHGQDDSYCMRHLYGIDRYAGSPPPRIFSSDALAGMTVACKTSEAS
jgi:hypothetical protein